MKIFTIFLICLFVLAFNGYAQTDEAQKINEQNSPISNNLTAEDNAYTLGKKDARIKITMFSDFQCPFCAKDYPLVKELLDIYPDDVCLVMKIFPLPQHPMALPAAKAALAAGEQNKFYEMADVLFEKFAEFDENKIYDYADQAGLDANKFMSDYMGRDAQWQEKIDQNIKLGESLGVDATPAFYLNGQRVYPGDIDAWKKLIDDHLAIKK